MNIVDPILFQCQRQPPVPAICVPGPGIGLISYRRLERFIHNISRRLHSLGMPAQSVVGVNVEDTIFHIAVVLALTRLGMITLSLREGDVSAPIKLDALVTTTKQPLLPTMRVVFADMSWTEGDGQMIEPHLMPQSHEDDLCRIVLTSGTTAEPKAVALSHRLLAVRMARHLTVFGNRLGNCSRIYSDMPLSSSLGFQFLIYTLSRGGLFAFPGDSFPNTLRVLEDYKIQCLVGSPGGFENLLRWFDTIPSYQSGAEVLFCAGDNLSRSLMDRVRGRICSHLVSVYGATETSMTATAHAHEIANRPQAVGFVTPGAVVQIVDDSGTVMPPGHEGIVRIRSDYAVDSYFGNPAESGEVFRGGWFYPGDVGARSSEGLLTITGRVKAIINLGGDKISPERIERIVSQFKGVIEVAAFSVPNMYGNQEVAVAVVCRDKVEEQQLRAHCEALLPRPFAPVKYYFVDNLPYTQTGKIDRRKLVERIAN